MTNTFQDQTIIISGGTGSLGRALGDEFAAPAAHVILLDIRAPISLPANCTFIACDMREAYAVHRAVKHIYTETGSIDVMIANAGIHLLSSLIDTSPEQLNTLFQTNVFGAFYLTQAVLPYMQTVGYGRLLLMGSEQAQLGRAHSSAYGMGKAALVQLAKSCSAEYAKYNILTNCLCPSTIADTTMTEQSLAYFQKITSNASDVLLQQFANEQLTGNLITLTEVVNWSLQLCSRENQSVTGQALQLDAGLSVTA